MRLLILHAASLAATFALLVGCALPALRTPAGAPASGVTPAGDRLLPAASSRRVLGVYVDPWHTDEWAAAVGAAPQAVAKFQAFTSRRPLRPFLAEAQRRGLRAVLIGWEPWTPVPSVLGAAAQARPQPGLRTIDIARGAQDRTITAFARAVRGFRGTVYLRYAHEMNGYWYPWSGAPRAYRWAWQRVVRLVRAAGALNVRFVWSVNANLYEPERAWRTDLRRYWPGAASWISSGVTMINFGGRKTYPVRSFAPRLAALRTDYGRPVLLAETNTERDGSGPWLADLRRLLARRRWIRGLFWSQLPSRAGVQQPGSGVLDWDITQDPVAAAQLRATVADGLR